MRTSSRRLPATSTFIPTALYGVVGWPLGQTLSPLLHNTAFQALGLPAVYLRWPIPPGGLPGFLESVRLLDIRGASVTIPHKIALLSLLDEVTEQAGLTGAVNTIYHDGAKVCGENTDVTGFLAPLADIDAPNADALLLGSGGAAHAAAAGLTLRRFRRVFIATPSDKNHLEPARRFSCTPVLWRERHDVPVDIVVNATPLGMCGAHENETPLDFKKFARPREGSARPLTVYDMVYNPLETRFLREARLAGHNCISGLSMFLGQGAAQFRIWTGEELPPAAFEALRTRLNAVGKI
ncbi:MAG: shikimate dehydrogenase [Desulfovibrio sp.]|nr:shikimate dehydrogenase [Desulfovibrio sp.]